MDEHPFLYFSAVLLTIVVPSTLLVLIVLYPEMSEMIYLFGNAISTSIKGVVEAFRLLLTSMIQFFGWRI